MPAGSECLLEMRQPVIGECGKGVRSGLHQRYKLHQGEAAGSSAKNGQNA